MSQEQNIANVGGIFPMGKPTALVNASPHNCNVASLLCICVFILILYMTYISMNPNPTESLENTIYQPRFTDIAH